MKRLFLLAALPLAVVGAGCNTYSYFNIDLKLTPSTFSSANAGVGSVTGCHMFVTGSDTDNFELSSEVCMFTANQVEIGTIDYSTFADSGSDTFTLKLFKGQGESDACQVGTGSVQIAVKSGGIAMGTLTATGTPPDPSCN